MPSKLIIKLWSLGMNNFPCNFILDFLTGCHQVARVEHNTCVDTGASQEFVLSPLLYSLFTHDYVGKQHDSVATHNSNSIIKFADDTTVVGLITNSEESTYREEVSDLAV